MEDFNRVFDEAGAEIANGTDGPVTRYVMICRAIEAARAGRFAGPRIDGVGSTEPLADALFAALGFTAECDA